MVKGSCECKSVIFELTERLNLRLHVIVVNAVKQVDIIGQ
jgi:hypothetical protein